MQNRYDKIWTVVYCCALSIALGCQQSPYELAPVSGKVLVDGHPLPRAKIMFAPIEVGNSVNPGKPAFGMLQSDGSFVLTTYTTDDGAVLGEHWVTIINLASDSTKIAKNAVAGSFSKVSLPERVKVQADAPNEFDFNLSNEDIKKFGVQIRD